MGANLPLLTPPPHIRLLPLYPPPRRTAPTPPPQTAPIPSSRSSLPPTSTLGSTALHSTATATSLRSMSMPVSYQRSTTCPHCPFPGTKACTPASQLLPS